QGRALRRDRRTARQDPPLVGAAVSDDLDEKFRDVTGNGHDTIDDFRRRSEEWDRAREQEHRLDFLIAEVRDLRRHIDGQFAKVLTGVEQLAITLRGTNDVLDRFMALANTNEKRINALEQRPSKRARKK